MAPTRLVARLFAQALVQLAALSVVTAQCSGSSYSYGSGACASCPSGASFISAASGCAPSATLTAGPTNTALYLSGSSAEGVMAYTLTGAAPTQTDDMFGNAGGALVLASGAHLDVAAGTRAPPALPSGNVEWSASAWVKCAAPTTWAAVVLWGADVDGSAGISAFSPRASVLAVGGPAPKAPGALVTTIVCSLRNPAFIVVIPETSMVVVALVDLFEYWLVSLAGTSSRLAGNANIGNGGYLDGVGSAARFNYVGGVAPLNNSMLVVADTGNHCIRLISYPGGAVTSLAGRCGPYTGNADGTGTNALFFFPGGVAVIPSNGVIVVADTSNGLLRLVTPLGSVTTLGAATGASFVSPVAVAILPSSGSIVVVGQDHRVRLVTYPAGIVTTLAGSGNAAFADGLGTAASFSSPSGVAVFASSGVIAVLRVCIESMLFSTRASDNEVVLWSEPMTLLLSPPHLGIFAASALLATLVLLAAFLRQNENAESVCGTCSSLDEPQWAEFVRWRLDLACAAAVACRVISESAAVAFLLGLDLLRLGLSFCLKWRCGVQVHDGTYVPLATFLLALLHHDGNFVFLAAFLLALLQAVFLGCALSSGACAGSSGWSVALICVCGAYTVLMLYRGRFDLWAAAHAAWCPTFRLSPAHSDDVSKGTSNVLTTNNPMHLPVQAASKPTALPPATTPEALPKEPHVPIVLLDTEIPMHRERSLAAKLHAQTIDTGGRSSSPIAPPTTAGAGAGALYTDTGGRSSRRLVTPTTVRAYREALDAPEANENDNWSDEEDEAAPAAAAATAAKGRREA